MSVKIKVRDRVVTVDEIEVVNAHVSTAGRRARIRPRSSAGGVPSAHATSHKDGGSDELLLHELGAPTASVDFGEQQAVNFGYELRTDDPVAPFQGQRWIRTDLI